MSKTRLSLFYLASYLWIGGAGMIFVPQLAATLLLSNAEYSSIMLQSLGMFMIGLGIIVIQIIRLEVKVLYPTTLVVRLVFCICLLVFFVASKNPFFLVLFGIVFLGVLLTGINYALERKKD
jgi:hypothetical protein